MAESGHSIHSNHMEGHDVGQREEHSRTADHGESEAAVVVLMIQEIRRDGGTQGRAALNASVVRQYAALMRDEIPFPPVRVWFDGSSYWLADGFHRVAAASAAGLTQISAQVLHGSLSDAIWDSCTTNSTHGFRRSSADIAAILKRALEHPNACTMSNVELARYLGLPETTVRRWRKRLSSSRGEDSVRVVSRKGTTYALRTRGITEHSESRHGFRPKSKRQLKLELEEVRQVASPKVAEILDMIDLWAFGNGTAKAYINALEEWVTLYLKDARL